MGRTTRGLVLAVGAALLSGTIAAQDKTPTIKDIMARLNKPGGLYPSISKELKADDTDWDEVHDQSKTFAKLAAELGKNAPPVGPVDSWAKLTKEYAENARALEAAAAKKDRTAANAARVRLGDASCKSCHAVHRKK